MSFYPSGVSMATLQNILTKNVGTNAIRYLLLPFSPTLPFQTVQSILEDPPPYCLNSVHQQRFALPEGEEGEKEKEES